MIINKTDKQTIRKVYDKPCKFYSLQDRSIIEIKGNNV
jgi:hypothetical protein